MQAELSRNRSLNILFVEDDPMFRDLVMAHLAKYNHKVRLATGVDAALAALAESPCEVLITDIGLPDGTGWYLLKRAGPVLCPYAIAISGFDSAMDVADSIQAGFRRHLIKPVVSDELIAALEEAAAILPATMNASAVLSSSAMAPIQPARSASTA